MRKSFFRLAILASAVSTLNAGIAVAQSKTKEQAKQEYTFEAGHTLDRAYVDRILTKRTIQLQKYLSILIEKKDPDYTKAIDKAMALFNNDESRLITVTSKVTGKTTVKPVRAYLTDVSRLPYKSVDIQYRNYSAIENIRKQPDGTFKGVVVFQQEFSGFNADGQAMYHDVVQRNAEVTIKTREYIKDQSHHNVTMDIFFGNMGVIEK